MTQPMPPTAPGQLTVNVMPVPHPTDPTQQLVALQLSSGPVHATVAPMSPEEAEQIGHMILARVLSTAAEVRRHNSGLIVPPPNGAGHLPPPPGYPSSLPRLGPLGN